MEKVRAISAQTGHHHLSIYSQLHRELDIDSYKELEPGRYAEALAYLDGLLTEGGESGSE
jgi:hypothetical protein